MSAAEQMIPDDEMDVATAAHYLGMRMRKEPWSTQTLYNILSTRNGPRCLKRRGRLIFRKVDLDQWIRENTEIRSANSR